MTQLAVGEHLIHVRESGAGAPVVLVHSSGMSSRQWKALVRVLDEDWHVLVPDLVGYGESSPWKGTGPFDLEEDLAVVEAVAARAGGPVHLVGHSYGALLCLFAAARARVEVASLALYEPIAFGVLRASGEGEAAADLVRAGESLYDPALEGTEEWLRRFVEYWGGPGAWQALPEQTRRRFGASGRKMFHEVGAVGADPTPREAYAGIAAPVLLLAGEHTTVAERRVCEILRDAMPAARLEVIAGAGHMGPLTHAAEVSRAIVRHLRAAGQREPS